MNMVNSKAADNVKKLTVETIFVWTIARVCIIKIITKICIY